VQLSIALSEEPEGYIQAATAWALGQIGRHTPEHAKAVAVSNVLPRLLQCYLRTDATEDLQTKVCYTNIHGLGALKWGDNSFLCHQLWAFHLEKHCYVKENSSTYWTQYHLNTTLASSKAEINEVVFTCKR